MNRELRMMQHRKSMDMISIYDNINRRILISTDKHKMHGKPIIERGIYSMIPSNIYIPLKKWMNKLYIEIPLYKMLDTDAFTQIRETGDMRVVFQGNRCENACIPYMI